MWYPGWDLGTEKGHCVKTKEIWIKYWVSKNISILVH